MNVSRFEEFLAAGDVVNAIVSAPFGYRSSFVDGVFHFRIDSGPRRGSMGEAATLLDAVKRAYHGAPHDGAPA